MTWFYTLDKIFSIRGQQLTILEAVKKEQVKIVKQTSLLMSEDQAHQEIEAIEAKYSTHIANMTEFLQSRISYIIESTLKKIELSDFLDHIVHENKDI